MVELIVVMVIMGILSLVAIERFFDNNTIQAREYADQARTVIRYAQKLAIAQNRAIYVSATASRFAACTASGCGAGTLVTSPAGANSGSTATTAACTSGGSYVSTWMCEGQPSSVSLTVPAGRGTEAGGANSFFAFDAMGRPYNAADSVPAIGSPASSTFTQLALTFSGSGVSYTITIEAETGYVH
jgi:MSHA pilin protein MshC